MCATLSSMQTNKPGSSSSSSQVLPCVLRHCVTKTCSKFVCMQVGRRCDKRLLALLDSIQVDRALHELERGVHSRVEINETADKAEGDFEGLSHLSQHLSLEIGTDNSLLQVERVYTCRPRRCKSMEHQRGAPSPKYGNCHSAVIK